MQERENKLRNPHKEVMDPTPALARIGEAYYYQPPPLVYHADGNWRPAKNVNEHMYGARPANVKPQDWAAFTRNH